MSAKEMFYRLVQFEQDGADSTTGFEVETFIMPTDNVGWQIYKIEYSWDSGVVELWPILGGCSIALGFYQILLNGQQKLIFDRQLAVKDAGVVDCSGEWTAPPTFYLFCSKLLFEIASSSTAQLNRVTAIIWYKKVKLTETQKFLLSLQG